MFEQGSGRTLPAGRTPENSDAAEVHVGVFLRGLFDPENAIWETSVADVLPAHVVEGLAAVRRAHAVDLHHDESQLGPALGAVTGRKTLRHEGTVGTGVDLLNDRILLVRVEGRGAVNHPVDVGLAVATLGHETLRPLPDGGLEFAGVGVFQGTNQRPIADPTQLVHRRHVHAGIRVDDELTVRRVFDRVRAVAGGQFHQARSVEVDAAVVDVIGILLGMNSPGLEPDLTLGRVYAVDLPHDPRALGDLVLQLSAAEIVQIQMVPPVAFRHPDHLVGGLQQLAMIVVGIIDEGLARVVDQCGDLAALGVDGHDPHRAVSSLVVVEREPTGVLVPAMRTDAPWVGEKRSRRAGPPSSRRCRTDAAWSGQSGHPV